MIGATSDKKADRDFKINTLCVQMFGIDSLILGYSIFAQQKLTFWWTIVAKISKESTW